jgi:transposase
MSVKIRVPHRDQVEMRLESLDEMLTPDHVARAVWEFVTQLDLTPWTSKIKSVHGGAGTKALDPRLLAALWIMATLDGICSARELSRLTETHMAYRWLCGGEPVNYHSLSDFRNSEPALLEKLLAESAAALMHADVADLKQVAQDGMRVRANAGASSFRREKTLRECLAEAEAQVAALKENQDEGEALPPRQASAQQRAAQERKERLEAALSNLAELQAENAQRPPCRRKEPSELRTSTTDPEATKMKMADGGFRPAYNVQFATTVAGGVVLGVSVTDEGVDSAQMEPMVEKIESLYGARPEAYLVDGGFVDQEAIGRVEESKTEVFAPVPRVDDWKAKGKDPYARRPGDTDAEAAWRQRMGTAEARERYKKRASTAEWVNAQARNHGLRQFMVRGMKKVLSSTFWYALTHNFRRHMACKLAAVV